MKTIFVSSTFSDMQYERDILQEKVLPIVNSRAKQYGDAVSFCDLRWGVNTLGLDSEAGEEKVLDICLDMIDRCDPVMIIILGERYGWIPDPALVKSASERKKMHLDSYDMSVTALEIEYGAFFKKKNTLVYYREVEGGDKLSESDPVRAQKLADLKKRIYTLTGGRVKNYRVKVSANGLQGADKFAEMVADDVCRLLSERWKEYGNLSPLDRELLMHEGVFTENAASCSTQGGVDEKITDYVKHGKKRLINLSGDSGTGKSVALGKVCQELKKSGYTVLPFSVGYTVNSTTSKGILESIVCWFEEKCGYRCEIETESVPWYKKTLKEVTLMDLYQGFFNKEDISGTTAKLEEYCKEFDAKGKKLVIIVDGLDKLHVDAATDIHCFIPGNIYSLENVKIIFSSVGKYAGNDTQAFITETYDEEQNRRILHGLLDKNNRELDPSVEREILSKSSGQYPQYINLLVTRLLMLNASDFRFMTDMKNISEYQKSVLRSCANSLGELGLEIINEACRRINGEFLMQALRFISVTREGLTEEQLRILCKDNFNKLDFYHLVSYMDDNFIMRDDGRYDFKTSYMKNAIFIGIQNPSDYAVPVMNMFMDNFFNEEVYKQVPDYTQVQEVAKLASDYCSDEEFLQVLKRFHSQYLQTRNEKSKGAFACMDVFCISIGKEGDRFVKFADNILKSYCCNSCNYNYYDVLFVVKEVVLSTSFEIDDDAEGGKELAERIYKNCLKVYQDLPEDKLDVSNLENMVSIAENLFTALGDDKIDDEEAARLCFDIIVKQYPEKLKNIQDATMEDLFNAYDKILCFAKGIQDKIPDKDPFSDEFRMDLMSDANDAMQDLFQTLGMMVMGYADKISQYPEALDRPLAIIVKGYNFCAQSLYLVEEYENAKSAYAVSIMYLSMSESLRANRHDYDVPSLSGLYEKVAEIDKKIGTKESLTEALAFYKSALDDPEEGSDEFTYYEDVDRVYVKLCEIDSSATEGRIANLNAACAAKAQYIYQYGIQFMAYSNLAEIYENSGKVNLQSKCCKEALEILLSLAKTIKDRIGDDSVYAYADPLESFTHFGEDLCVSILNNFYISVSFDEDVKTANAMFDKLTSLYKTRGDVLKNMSLQSLRKKFDKVISTLNFTEVEEEE